MARLRGIQMDAFVRPKRNDERALCIINISRPRASENVREGSSVRPAKSRRRFYGDITARLLKRGLRNFGRELLTSN